MISDAVLAAALTGPGAIALDRLVTWLRNRRKDDAEAGLAVDQRWENYTERLEDRLSKLEDRVDELEDELQRERDRAKGLAAEVDRYKRIARSLARHVLRLRDALAQTETELPPLPSDVEDALTIIDLP